MHPYRCNATAVDTQHIIRINSVQKNFYSLRQISFKVQNSSKLLLKEGASGFSVLRFWLFFRSVFQFFCVKKNSVFRFWRSLLFADLLFFSIWFSVFAKNTYGFSDLISDTVFGLSYFTYLGSGFYSVCASTDLKQPLKANVTKRNAWQTIWNIAGIPRGFTRFEWRPRLWPSVGVQASWMTLRDFDLAMWSTWVKVKQFANHVFQYAKCAGNGQTSWTLKSNFTLLYWNLLHVESSIGNWRRKQDDVPIDIQPQ